MRKLLIILFFMAAVSGQAKNLQAFLSYSVFNSPEKGPFVETYLSVSGKTVVFKQNKNGKYQASIDVTLIVKKDSATQYADKYNLLSPEIEDTNNLAFNFIDQQRILLPQGKYILKLNIADKNSTARSFTHEESIVVDFPSNAVNFSDIELVEKYTKATKPGNVTKGGYDLIPNVSNFFPKTINNLIFYSEIYNTQEVFKAEPFLLKYYIETYEKLKVMEKYSGYQREVPKKVGVLLSEIPITDLPSGNYNLVLEVRDKNNILQAEKKLFFQRSNLQENTADNNNIDLSNPVDNFAAIYTSKDTLRKYIRSLRPIATEIEKDFIDNQVKDADVSQLQQYLSVFWIRRNAKDPKGDWENYHSEVLSVNHAYGNRVTPGYETDRGRVYLQYGRPNSISTNISDNEAYPYEIWQYYKLKKQSNRIFVFYNTDLVTNDYRLLHSDALGEPNDPQWQMKIHSRNTPVNGFDQQNAGDNKLNDIIRNPH